MTVPECGHRTSESSEPTALTARPGAEAPHKADSGAERGDWRHPLSRGIAADSTARRCRAHELGACAASRWKTELAAFSKIE
jgi:hypothetical protein